MFKAFVQGICSRHLFKKPGWVAVDECYFEFLTFNRSFASQVQVSQWRYIPGV